MGFIDELKNTHAKIQFDKPMKKLTGYGVGGCAKYYAEIDTIFTLNEIISTCERFSVSYKIIGNGSNLLVSDDGFDGVIINTHGLCDVYFNKDYVRAMSGATLQKLIRFCLDNNLSGLEALSGIPATIGGAIVMNAGAFGKNISDKLVCVEILCDGKIIKYAKDQCSFGYRTSRFLASKEIIISATFQLVEAERELILAGIEAYKDLRKCVQPTGRSCGSVFKNPNGYAAGRLIDSLNLKGYSIGGAKISKEHANFIVTEGKTTATEIKQLIDYVKKKVLDVYNIELKEEIEYVGEF